MCGIAGRLSPRGVRREQVEAMSEALRHRGPDDAGLYLADHAALAHRRLSIIDLTHGKQPIANEDESIWIVFNGEIYNYRELTPRLIAKGHTFRTETDTEVILHAYEEYGTDCVEHLRGMFAFAIWDGNRRRLFAARDRLGQKPFYYTHPGKDFAFASEIKALLAADPSLAEIDLNALDQYLTLRVIASPRSMFRGVAKLPPAHRLIFDADSGALRVERYWDLSYEPKHDRSDDELLEELEHRLVECVRLHLISDVPVGAFLSGGLDSTLVVAIAMAHGLAPDLQTFSFGLPYGQYNEAPYARMVAEKYGTRHHEEIITPSLLDTLPALVHHLDEPSDPLAVCQYLISQHAAKHVKVVLGGEGGDELFGGYDRYYGNRYADHYARLPDPLRRFAIGPMLRLVPDGRWYKSKAHQLKWMHHLSFHRGGSRYAKGLGYFYFRQPMRSQLYGPAMRASNGFDPEASVSAPYESALAEDAVDRMLYADCQVRLPDHPVMILDRMTMAHGLEARAPLMDHVVAEFAARLPAHLKVRARTTRYIQRQLAKKYLPEALMTRPKQGFQSALPYMLRDEYELLFGLFLRDARLARAGILVQPVIDRMLQQHLAGRADHGNRLWLLLNAEVWHRARIEGVSPADLSAEVREAAQRRCAV